MHAVLLCLAQSSADEVGELTASVRFIVIILTAAPSATYGVGVAKMRPSVPGKEDAIGGHLTRGDPPIKKPAFTLALLAASRDDDNQQQSRSLHEWSYLVLVARALYTLLPSYASKRQSDGCRSSWTLPRFSSPPACKRRRSARSERKRLLPTPGRHVWTNTALK